MYTLISTEHSLDEALDGEGSVARVVHLDYWKAFDCYDCVDLADEIFEYPPSYCSLCVQFSLTF